MNLTFSAKRASRLTIVAIMGAGLAVSAQAETVLVDFGSSSSFRGVSVPNPDPNGHYWNSLTPGPFYPNLIDINNTVTSVALGYDTGVGTDSYNGPAGPTSFPNPTPAEIAATDIDTVALGDLGVKEAGIDFAASPGGLDNHTRFQIQGLNTAEKYTLKLFGSHEFSDDDSTIYSVFNDAAYSSQIGGANLLVQTPGSPWLHNRDTVATIGGLSPSSSGILYVQFIGSNGSLGYLNSFELIGTVPEPTSLMLLVSAAGLVFGYRRR